MKKVAAALLCFILVLTGYVFFTRLMKPHEKVVVSGEKEMLQRGQAELDELSFSYPLQYPEGREVFLQSQNGSLRLQNYVPSDDVRLKQGEFFLEVDKNEQSLLDTMKFDEDRGQVVYGENTFHNGVIYGPYEANKFVVSSDPQFVFSFYGFYDQDLVEMILSSVSL